MEYWYINFLAGFSLPSLPLSLSLSPSLPLTITPSLTIILSPALTPSLIPSLIPSLTLSRLHSLKNSCKPFLTSFPCLPVCIVIFFLLHLMCYISLFSFSSLSLILVCFSVCMFDVINMITQVRSLYSWAALALWCWAKTNMVILPIKSIPRDSIQFHIGWVILFYSIKTGTTDKSIWCLVSFFYGKQCKWRSDVHWRIFIRC